MSGKMTVSMLVSWLIDEWVSERAVLMDWFLAIVGCREVICVLGGGECGGV